MTAVNPWVKSWAVPSFAIGSSSTVGRGRMSWIGTRRSSPYSEMSGSPKGCEIGLGAQSAVTYRILP